MSDFEQIIEKAVADEDIPGCVLAAINRDGTFKYTKAFGKRSVTPGADQSPLRLDTVMWVASCTKIMTSIAALQLVERGLVTLDEPVYSHIPELKTRPVLTSFNEDGTPVQEPHKNPITLRILLTHSSGLGYEALNPLLTSWAHHLGRGTDENQAPKLLDRFDMPLVFEPGTDWIYGTSIDYAGLLVERITKVSLEDYMRKNIWDPLGIKDMTFHLSKRPDMAARMADMAVRDLETGKLGPREGVPSYGTKDGGEVEDCLGGQGVFASAEEYIKVLHGLLTTEDNEILLKKETVELLFSPQLSEKGAETLNALLQIDMVNHAMGVTPASVRKDWGLGGLLLKGDVPNGRREGTLIWGGLPNLLWYVDRKTGLAVLYAGQVLPYGDAKVASLVTSFEKGIYERYSKHT